MITGVAMNGMSNTHGPMKKPMQTPGIIHDFHPDIRRKAAKAMLSPRAIAIAQIGTKTANSLFISLKPTSRVRGPDTLWRVPWTRLFGPHYYSIREKASCCNTFTEIEAS